MKIEDTYLKGLYCDEATYKNAISANVLLNLDLDLSNVCNLNCTYCDKVNFQEKHKKKENELTFSERKSIILQAKALGCKTIQFIGAGEPTLDPYFVDTINLLKSLDIVPVVYTNGTTITEDLAKWLFDCDASIVLKYNSLIPKVQDAYVGKTGYHNQVARALNTLQEMKFNSSVPTRLAIDCIITRENYNEIFDIFVFCREHNISPQIAGVIPHGLALKNKMYLKKTKLLELAKRVQKYDFDRGLKYNIILPFIGGFKCKQVKYGMYVDVEGNVWECNAGELKIGNIRAQSLKELWFSDCAKNFRKSWSCGVCHIRTKYYDI